MVKLTGLRCEVLKAKAALKSPQTSPDCEFQSRSPHKDNSPVSGLQNCNVTFNSTQTSFALRCFSKH